MGLEYEWLTGEIIGAGIDVMRELGPGFLESIYEEAMAIALRERGLSYERQRPVRVFFRGSHVGLHRLDLLVEDQIVVELKAIQSIQPVHRAIVLSYLRATHRRIGLILNFHGATLAKHRILNSSAAPEPPSPLPPPVRSSAFRD